MIQVVELNEKGSPRGLDASEFFGFVVVLGVQSPGLAGGVLGACGSESGAACVHGKTAWRKEATTWAALDKDSSSLCMSSMGLGCCSSPSSGDRMKAQRH